MKKMKILKRNTQSYRYVYQIKNTGQKYVFRITHRGDGWISYIDKFPDSEKRNMNTHMTHRVYDKEKDKYYISWCQPVKSSKDMEAISNCWAELMQRYLDTGEPFG